MNTVAEALTGWTDADATGKPFADVFQNFDPETRERCDNSVAKLVAEPHTLDVGRRCSVLVARDLAEHPIEESTAPIRDAEGRAIGIVRAFRDITDALRIQEERAKASKLASLGLLAGGMAHDFNNILMSVMGNVSMARATMAPPPSSTDWLAEAEQACVRARQLTWQLLTFSKGGVPTRKTVAIPQILHESVGLALRGSGVTCTFDMAPDLWTVDADAGQLAQVFSNVMLNARQAMRHSGVITVRAENVCEVDRRWENALRVEPGRYVRVSIVDKGVGIPKEHLSRIFDPYFSTKQGGSGLGLATTHSIVKNHGGFLAVDSQAGSGTTIHVNFPAAGSREATEQIDPAAALSVDGKHRVLVMDDEAPVRTLTMNMLDFLGYDAEVAHTGSAAVERFKRALTSNHPFDVVMLDLVVPGDIGGTEAMDQLGALDPAVKAILMSGCGQDPVVRSFQSHGFQAVITKPFTLRELNAALHSVIGSATWPVH
jgi:PAS domain S-box-containing protein